MRPRILAGVGAYNEARTLGDVLARFEPGVVDEIVVLDDGSTDETPEIIARAGVACIRHPERRGAGAAIKSAIRYGRERGYDILVLLAGNGKDDPRLIPRLLAPILDQGFDYVQGSRNLPDGGTRHQPLHRTVLVRLLAVFYRTVTGFPSTDPSNGMRAYRLAILDNPRINVWQDWLDGYELEHYLNYLVLKLRYRVCEVPVTKVYPAERGVRYSHARPVVDWWHSLRPIFLLALGLRK